MTPDQRLRRIRILLGGFIFGVVISGVTAFPLTWEVNILVQWFGQGDGGLATWLRTVQAGLQNNDQNYPFIAYGTDWLAFGHLAIAGAFIGPYRDPVKNKFIIQWGMWTCALVPLLAFSCGPHQRHPLRLAHHRLPLRHHRNRAALVGDARSEIHRKGLIISAP